MRMIKKFLLNHPVHKKIVPYLDIIFLLRPTIFFSIWGVIVLGMISVNNHLNNVLLWNDELSMPVIFIFISLTFLISASFINILKDSDQKTDCLLIENNISLDGRKKIIKILFSISMIILVLFNWLLIIPLLCIYYIIGIGYNSKPIHWHSSPYRALMALTFVSFLLYAIGGLICYDSSLNNDIEIFVFKYSLHLLSYILSFISIISLIIVNDLKNDYSLINSVYDGKYNYFIFLVIPLVFLPTSLMLAWLNKDPILSTAVLVFLPFFIFSCFRKLNKDIIRSIRYPIFIINFFTFSYYPWFALCLLITYYLSKYYYWHRFNWHYPTFLIEDD